MQLHGWIYGWIRYCIIIVMVGSDIILLYSYGWIRCHSQGAVMHGIHTGMDMYVDLCMDRWVDLRLDMRM